MLTIDFGAEPDRKFVAAEYGDQVAAATAPQTFRSVSVSSFLRHSPAASQLSRTMNASQEAFTEGSEEAKKDLLHKATKETKIEIDFQNLRYLRFLLLNAFRHSFVILIIRSG